MKFPAIFCVVFLLNALTCDAQVVTGSITCGSVRDHSEISALGELRTCFVGADATIDSRNFQLTDKNETYKGLSFGSNKKVSYLPLYVGDQLPNLLVYVGASCSVRSISKENFKNLKKLKALVLDNNKIEKLFSDTFEDLIALEHIDLRNNKIKYMNQPELFGGLVRLKTLKLRENVCIDENFATQEKFIAWALTDDKNKCGFCKSEEPAEVEFCEMSHKTHDNIQYLIENSSCKK